MLATGVADAEVCRPRDSGNSSIPHPRAPLTPLPGTAGGTKRQEEERLERWEQQQRQPQQQRQEEGQQQQEQQQQHERRQRALKDE